MSIVRDSIQTRDIKAVYAPDVPNAPYAPYVLYKTEATEAVRIRHFVLTSILNEKDAIKVKENLKTLKKDMKTFIKYVEQQRGL